MTPEEQLAAAIKALVESLAVSEEELERRINAAVDAKLKAIANLLWREGPTGAS
jgi:hypothetical protein